VVFNSENIAQLRKGIVDEIFTGQNSGPALTTSEAERRKQVSAFTANRADV
jgi:hypothetical protein